MFEAVSSVAVSLGGAISTAAVEGTLVERDLPIPPYGFGIIAICSFMILLGITYSFRSVAYRR